MSKPGIGLLLRKAAKDSAGSPPPVGIPNAPKDVKKRWIYIGIGVFGAIMISSSLLGGKPAEPTQRKREGGTVAVTPPNLDKQAFEARFAKDMEALKSSVEAMASTNARHSEEILRLREKQQDIATGKGAAGTGGVPPPSKPGEASNTGGLGFVVPPPIPPGRAGASPTSQVPAAPPSPPAVPMAPPVPALVAPAAPVRFPAPELQKSSEAGSVVKAKAKLTKNPSFGLLPAGSFASMMLLNGLDAGTSSSTQTNPQPMLMTVTDHAMLPGSARYRLKSCFVLATVYGDLSAERVYGRTSRLSCLDQGDRLVLSQEVQGYLVDSDGKLGLRGRVTDRQGAKLAKAVLAGFAQGLSGAFGQAQGITSSNITTGTVTNSISGAAALRASGLSGAQAASQQLAEFYLKEAQNIFPVITVDSGRLGTIVFTSGTTLNWAPLDGQYTEQVTPESK